MAKISEFARRRSDVLVRVLPAEDRRSGARPREDDRRARSRWTRRSCRSPTAPAARPGSARATSSCTSSATSASRRWPTSPASPTPASSSPSCSVEYREAGIDNILALAGDPPQDLDDYPRELTYATELIELVREIGDFSVGVAAHPELHPRSEGDRDLDRRYLAAKLVDADFGITQFFFEAEPYLRMIDELAALGNETPVLPGIIPVTNAKQVQRFAQLAGAEFPAALAAQFDAVADDPAEVRKVGVALATELCQTLLDEGVPGIHFYTLNRSTATREIYANLGLGPAEG